MARSEGLYFSALPLTGRRDAGEGIGMEPAAGRLSNSRPTCRTLSPAPSPPKPRYAVPETFVSASIRCRSRLLISLDGSAARLSIRARGKPSNHRANEGVREYALELVRTQYRDFSPTLAIEAPVRKARHRVGRETLFQGSLRATMSDSRSVQARSPTAPAAERL